MFDAPTIVPIAAFLAVSGGTMALLIHARRHLDRVDNRIEAAAQSEVDVRGRGGPPLPQRSLGQGATTMIADVGAKLLPDDQAKRSRQQSELIAAGFYSPHALSVFSFAKLALLLAPFVVAGALHAADACSLATATKVGLIGGLLAFLVPGVWLNGQKRRRQSVLRRSLPDFLDLTVVCLESGMSLQGAVQRVADELQIAHPALAGELRIIQREVELGGTPDAALRHFAERTQLDAARSLATFVHQSLRFGAPASNAFRIHSDSLRTQREQRAEELAQKAAVKILMPTMICIFPAIFVVAVGPAAILLQERLTGPNSKSTTHVQQRAYVASVGPCTISAAKTR